jgi:CheY-like chemotaxis protein
MFPPPSVRDDRVLAQIESSDLAVSLVPEKVARLHQVVPIGVDNRVLTYATCAPYSPDADRDLGFASGRRTSAVAATRAAVIKALDQCYPTLSDLDVLGHSLRASLEKPKPPAQQAEATIEMCSHIVARAVKIGATEVQLACDGQGATLRYLIGGAIESEIRLPMADAIRDRFKVMGRLAVAVRHRPQTGNFRLMLNGQGTTANLSTAQTAAGETIVIQLVDQRPPAAGTAIQRGSGGRSRVLVADDDAVTRMLIKRLLERENFDVIEARDGDEAVALVTRERPDVVLLDLNMPVMDGYEAIHHLRHDSSLPGLPIIVLTAEDGPTVERRVLTMGADDFMIKPFEAPVLLSRVNAVFSRLKMKAA